MKAKLVLLTAIGLATSLQLSGHTLGTPLPPGTLGHKTPDTKRAGTTPDAEMAMQAAGNTDRLSSANPLWSIPLANLAETRRRPLFTPSRRASSPRPIPDTRPPAEPAKQAKLQLALVGTIIRDTEGWGLFIDRITEAPVRLKTGGEYQGWIVRSLRRDEVVLQSKDFSTTLSLPRENLKDLSVRKHSP